MNISIKQSISRWLLWGLLPLFLATSCKRFEDPTFSQTASERADNVIRETLDILTSSDNGWLLRIYPSESKKYGGYNVLLKFGKDGRFSTLSELQPKGTNPQQGEFTLDNSEGPTLSFTGYARGIHMFSEPNPGVVDFIDPIAYVSYLVNGADGDYSFQIVKVSKESITLRGARTGVYATLLPASTEDWEKQNLAYIKASEDYLLPEGSTLEANGKTYTVRMLKRHFYVTVDGKELSAPFVFTPNGFVLYEPITIDGKELKEMNRVKTDSFSGLANSEGSIRISAPKYTPAEWIQKGLWYLDTERSHSQHMTRAVRDISNLGIKAGFPHETPLIFAILGSIDLGNNVNGFGIFTNFESKGISNDGNVTYQIPLDLEILGDNEVKTTYNESRVNPKSRSGEILFEFGLMGMGQIFSSSLGHSVVVTNPNTGAEQSVYPWGGPAVVGKTYTISLDDNSYPTEVTLTNKNNSKEVLILTKALPFAPKSGN